MILFSKKKKEALMEMSYLLYKLGLNNWSYSNTSLRTVQEHIGDFWCGKWTCGFSKEEPDKFFDADWFYYDGPHYHIRLWRFWIGSDF